MVLLAAYFAVMAEVFLATARAGQFRMSFMGVGPTELRLVLAAGALALMRDPRVAIPELGSFGLFDVGAAVATAGLDDGVPGVGLAERPARSMPRSRSASRVPVAAPAETRRPSAGVTRRGPVPKEWLRSNRESLTPGP